MKPAVGPIYAAAMTLVLVALLLGTVFLARGYGWTSWSALAFVFASVASLAFLSRKSREPSTPAGRELQIEDSKLRQIDTSGEVCQEIDLTRALEYRFLENEQDENARVRIFQDGQTLTFYTSDPGAANTIRIALQRPWPSRLTMRLRVREGRLP